MAHEDLEQNSYNGSLIKQSWALAELGMSKPTQSCPFWPLLEEHHFEAGPQSFRNLSL